MAKTNIDIAGDKFRINGRLTYSEIDTSKPSSHGLLMNARFIQGIFDDKAQPERFARFGKDVFDPEQNTNDLIAALPEWYAHGMRAFTVGLQGGGPVFTVNDFSTIKNSPFSEDGKSFDISYENRLDRLIRAADELGMAVIVSLFYQAQAHRLSDGKAVRNAVDTACSVLKNGNYTNVIIEVANEHGVGNFSKHPIISSNEGIAYLIELAREKSNGMMVGSSEGGGEVNREVCEASDIILIHGNGCTRQEFYDLIRKAKEFDSNKPIVCNEDSPCYSKMGVAFDNGVSWGYYNNLTKQEPPADWTITLGEDTFFARRMAEGIGIELPVLKPEDCYYLQGFEPDIAVGNKRWIRLASLYPEKINRVEFYRNGALYYIAYNEPFMVHSVTDWVQEPCDFGSEDRQFDARIYLHDGNSLVKSVKLLKL